MKAAPSASPPQRNLATLFRFLGSLHFLKRILPLVLFLIALASGTPQFFLWMIGELVRCSAEPCRADVLGLSLPLSLGALTAIALFGMTMRILAWAAFELSGAWSTNVLHDRMIAALARARTTYFDETPSGHLINRILGDFGNLRLMGVIRVGDATNAIFEVVATGILVLLVNPWPALAIVPVTLAFAKVQLDIGPMMGHAEEISSQWKGELVHRETDMIEGSRIVDLYGKRAPLLASVRDAAKKVVDARILAARLQAWSRAWQRVLSAGYGFLVFLFLTLGIEAGRISLTLAAVIVSTLFALTASFNWLTWCLTFLTETLGNARRVFELVDLPSELASEGRETVSAPQSHASDVHPAAQTSYVHPLDIEFARFSMSYREGTPEILRSLDLVIPAGKRVGLVGRTGAGKSSLLQALFRMVRVTGGDVTIGGASIYEQDVTKLRSLFGVVPQTPYLFQGTVRANLDRSGTASDDAVLRALAAVELSLSPESLVEEGGRNLSLGERQLLCLARVLLAEKPYVVMDEPTSAVDVETDVKIQAVLERHLGGRTILAIAHRLETLARYDLVVEMEAGRVKRMGPPSDFL